jgi:alkyl hydroperoxide reductase subunit AhpF
MHGLTFIQCCAVCRRPWIAVGERWRAYHIGGEPCEPGESIVFYCPDCAEREFDGE